MPVKYYSVFAQLRCQAGWHECISCVQEETERHVSLLLNSKVSVCKIWVTQAWLVLGEKKGKIWQDFNIFFSRIMLRHSRRFKASGRALLPRHPHWCCRLCFEEECGTLGESQWEKATLKNFLWCRKKTERRWAPETFLVIGISGMRGVLVKSVKTFMC